MRKNKLLLGTLLLALAFPLASCGILADSISNSVGSTGSSTIKKEMKYEVGTANVDSWTDSIGTTWIKYAVPVKNTGDINIYLGSMSVDIESSTGNLLKTESMISVYPSFIKPGEIAYYYDETIVDFDTTDIKIVPHVDVNRATSEIIRYEISDLSITNDKYSGVKVMGRVENNTSKKGTFVYVVANLFDSNDKLICNCFTILDNDLDVGDKIGFTCKPSAFRNITPDDVFRYEVYAYPLQFNF